MKIDFAKGFGYPAREPGWPVKILLASIFSYIIIGIPLTIGFVIESYRTSAEGDDQKMPEVSDFANLLLKGVQALIMSVIFLFVPLTCLGMGFGSGLLGIIGSMHTGTATGAATGMGMALVWMGLGAVTMLLAYLILPMATLRMATRGIGAAFDIGGIMSDIGKAPLEYVAILVAYAVALKLYGLASAFVAPLALLFPVVALYLSLVLANLMGQYSRAHLGE